MSLFVEMKISVVVPMGNSIDQVKTEIFKAAQHREVDHITIITADPQLNTVQVTSPSKDLIEFLTRTYRYTFKYPPLG